MNAITNLRKTYNNHETVITLLFFLVLWFGILMITGTLDSGYHFMDDHEILQFQPEIAKTTITHEAQKFITNLLHPGFRFRPFYLLHRRLEMKVFGTTLLVWSIYNAFLAVFTSFLLFLFMRRTGFSQIEAMFFALLTVLGEQAAIWWQLGPAETPGIFLLAAALLCMAESVYNQKRKKVMTVLFVVFAILASWCKESFVLMLPALVFWKILLAYQQGSTTPSQKTMGHTIKENSITAAILLSVCLWELIHIYNGVTMMKIRYAGSQSLTVFELMKATTVNLLYLGGGLVVVLFVLLALFFYQRPPKDKTGLILSYLFLAAMITGPQILLYMKAGITERYQLPGKIGIILLILVLYQFLNDYFKKSSVKKVWGKKILVVVLVMLVVITLNQLRITRYTAIGFTRAGHYIQAWFQSIAHHTGPTDITLVITNPITSMEASYALQIYMNTEMKRQNILFSTVQLDTINKKHNTFWGVLNNTFFARFKTFSLDKAEDRNLIRAILIFPGLEKKFLHYFAARFKAEQFKRYTNAGGYVSYYRESNCNSSGFR